jgi:outer membrane lipoprotein-sorting protein
MRRSIVGIGIVFGMMAAGLVHAEQTLESVENEVEALWAKIDAFSAKMTSDTTVAMGLTSMKSHATGTLECLKQGDVALFRLEMLNKIDTGIPLVGAVEQKALSVFDGKNLYNEMEAIGIHKAFRTSGAAAADSTPASGKSMFAEFRRKGELKLLPDTTVDGEAAYVVEVTPNAQTKSASPTPVGSIKYYISKKLGLQIKIEVLDDEGQPTTAIVYSDVDVNAKLAPERFEYKAPAGVTVQDMSKMKLPGK